MGKLFVAMVAAAEGRDEHVPTLWVFSRAGTQRIRGTKISIKKNQGSTINTILKNNGNFSD